jgi:hypothetical protein
VADGVPPGRLRGSDLEAPFFGVRSPDGFTEDIVSRARAYATRMPDAQFFSHWTAAQLWGFRLPENFRERRPLDVSVASPERAPRSKRVNGHQTMTNVTPIVRSDGLRVSSVLETWCQLAALAPLDDLIAIGDGLVRRKDPPCELSELEDAVAARVHQPGSPALRRALEHVRPRTDSWRETLLRLMIVRAGFREPEVNPEISDGKGRFLGFGDLVYRRERVLLEYDGRQHWEDGRQFARDIARLDEFMADNWRVIRVDKALMSRPAVLFSKLESALIRNRPLN